MKSANKIHWALLTSLLLHFFILVSLPRSEKILTSPSKPLQAKLKTMRNVGKKKGAKEISIPLPKGSKKITNKNKNVHIIKSSNDHSIKALSAHHHSPAVRKTGFNIAFTVPEGVEENELNSVEKKFWSFKKRVYMSYVSSFASTYNTFNLQRPRLQESLHAGKHLLRGSITFDKEGHMMKIKLEKSSYDDNINDLLEETLKGIGKIPNPPKDIIANGNFTIYYLLKINSH